MGWSHGNFDHHLIAVHKARSMVNKINSSFSRDIPQNNLMAVWPAYFTPRLNFIII